MNTAPAARSTFDVRTAALLLGVSDDTLRRAVTRGDLPAEKDAAGHLVIDGAHLVDHAEARAEAPSGGGPSSARNRFVGLVTDVRSDSVMSQVQLRCGPFTVTSLMSTDAVTALGLRRGCLAAAVVKATTVVVEPLEALG